jgi:tRNA A22 N-methylase
VLSLARGGPSPIIDVGADHGHVAAALGSIATERDPRRIGRQDVTWVVADGLRPFRRVGTAIIAGMGANTIIGILSAGPSPEVAVLHAQDDPPTLRRWLAANGWRLDVELPVREGRGFAIVIRARPGVETASGLHLHHGPRLLEQWPPGTSDAVDHDIAALDALLARPALPEIRQIELREHRSFLVDQRSQHPD